MRRLPIIFDGLGLDNEMDDDVMVLMKYFFFWGVGDMVYGNMSISGRSSTWVYFEECGTWISGMAAGGKS